MIIGVTGDTHNNLKNISNICTIFNKNGADIVFHTGDISLPKSLISFNTLKCPVIAIIGNNDVEEKDGLEEAAKTFDCKIFEEPYSIELNSIQISVIHHPELINSKMLEENDLILHGHTHRYRMEKVGKTIIFNPGECAGFMRGKNQVGLIDLKEMKPKIVNF